MTEVNPLQPDPEQKTEAQMKAGPQVSPTTMSQLIKIGNALLQNRETDGPTIVQLATALNLPTAVINRIQVTPSSVNGDFVDVNLQLIPGVTTTLVSFGSGGRVRLGGLRYTGRGEIFGPGVGPGGGPFDRENDRRDDPTTPGGPRTRGDR